MNLEKCMRNIIPIQSGKRFWQRSESRRWSGCTTTGKTGCRWTGPLAVALAPSGAHLQSKELNIDTAHENLCQMTNTKVCWERSLPKWRVVRRRSCCFCFSIAIDDASCDKQQCEAKPAAHFPLAESGLLPLSFGLWGTHRAWGKNRWRKAFGIWVLSLKTTTPKLSFGGSFKELAKGFVGQVGDIRHYERSK
jgi:hypothetical protein